MVGNRRALKALFSSPEDLKPFGWPVNTILETPIGAKATVLGVRYKDTANKQNPQLILRYSCDIEAPADADMLTAARYVKCSEADHIKRDVTVLMMEQLDLQRRWDEHNAEAARLAAEEAAAAAAVAKKAPKKKAPAPQA